MPQFWAALGLAWLALAAAHAVMGIWSMRIRAELEESQEQNVAMLKEEHEAVVRDIRAGDPHAADRAEWNRKQVAMSLDTLTVERRGRARLEAAQGWLLTAAFAVFGVVSVVRWRHARSRSTAPGGSGSNPLGNVCPDFPK
jgi:hypothetical protein